MKDDESPVVSVIIPAYNAEPYLSRAVDSVLEQENCHFELIIVDNNSDDATLEVAKVYQRRFPQRVRVLKEPKSGASAARNKGLRAAAASYVKFLDADDRLLPGQLSRQYALMRPGIDWLIGTIRIRFLDGRVVDAPIAEDPWQGMLAYTGLGHLNANLFRKELLLQLGGFDGAYPSCDDFELFFRYLKGAYAYAKDEIPGAEHIHHQGPRITNSRLTDMARQRIRLTERVSTHLLKARPAYYEGNRSRINAYVLRAIRKQATVDLDAAKESLDQFFPQGYRAGDFEQSLLPKFAVLYPVFGVLPVERLRAAITRFIFPGLRRWLK